MNYLHPFCEQINLHVKGRISKEDADRQEQTAREILKRLTDQPGVVLADEVGMGKTFVALATAVSVALSNRGKQPVVVMVPPSLKAKWPTDFELFREKCLPPALAERVKWGKAERAVEFLKLLDDPPERRRSILFVTHGAMSRGLNDGWVKLALIYQALRRRRNVEDIRRALGRTLGKLLYLRYVERNGAGIWQELLKTHPSRWLERLHAWSIDPENDDDPTTDDDPVPRAVWEVLPEVETGPILECLHTIPRRRSSTFEARLVDARRLLTHELRALWRHSLGKLKLRLPLLILDEAHHLKNPKTRLASLFQVADAANDADEITKGPLASVFERMVFLTATPFQLGHSELCSVLDRFDGIRWQSRRAPAAGQEEFKKQRTELRAALDAAQEAAVTLDDGWGRLRVGDLVANGQSFSDVDTWWETATAAEELTPAARHVVRCYNRTRDRMKIAETRLQPWVIRHLKARYLPEPHQAQRRRKRLPGRTILDDSSLNDGGIPVAGASLLPFLLAARASSHAPKARPVFAEGLASSYEAFLHTRLANLRADGEKVENACDEDDDEAKTIDATDGMKWYLDRLENLLPRDNPAASAQHPKIAATVARTVDLWRSGEKVVVFCHYIATGRTLRQRISEAIEWEIEHLGAAKLGCDPLEVADELDRFGKQFFKEESPIRRACDAEITKLIGEFPALADYESELLDVVRRNLRTPSFLARFFPLDRSMSGADAMASALDARDRSNTPLRKLLSDFFDFLVARCGTEDRRRYVEAVGRIQTGAHLGKDVAQSFAPDERQGDGGDRLIPNVRLVNGSTKQDTRQRLMLTFNTPFYPEVLVASSVMAEGVDLHLNCRYVIHHDLCWNPSTLEQRTGRIDRIGAKAERCGAPIHVYLPYIAATQDEKMYRVVMDRERWFSVVMGEDYKVDARTTEKLANRILLPEAAATELAFRLGISDSACSSTRFAELPRARQTSSRSNPPGGSENQFRGQGFGGGNL